MKTIVKGTTIFKGQEGRYFSVWVSEDKTNPSVFSSHSVELIYFVQCTVQCICIIHYISQYSDDCSGRFYLQVTERLVFFRVYFK